MSDLEKQGETPRMGAEAEWMRVMQQWSGHAHYGLTFGDIVSAGCKLKAELAQMAAQKAELEAKLAEEQKDALCWKRLAERHYAARAYPANQHLAEGSLDAYFKAHRDEILAAERKEGKP